MAEGARGVAIPTRCNRPVVIRSSLGLAGMVGAMLLAGCSAGQIVNQPTTRGASTATPSPAATGRVAHVGDPLVLQGNGDGEQVTITLVKVVDPAQGSDEFDSPDAGNRFVSLELQVKNTGTVTYSDSYVFTAVLLDTKGESFSTNLSTTTAGPPFANGGVDESPGDVERSRPCSAVKASG
jgi:hypothetical protein